MSQSFFTVSAGCNTWQCLYISLFPPIGPASLWFRRMRPYSHFLLASVATGLAIQKNPTEATQPVTFHFVPGSFHGPWAFDLIRAELASRGFKKSSASTLPSVGNADPDVALYADAAAVRTDLEALVDAGQKVVLVAHSYGGAVSSNAVEGLSVQQRTAAGRQGGIINHIFLTALALPVGQTALDAFNGTRPAWWNVTVLSACGYNLFWSHYQIIANCIVSTLRMTGNFSPLPTLNRYFTTTSKIKRWSPRQSPHSAQNL